MKSLNNYIVEKFKISKDIKNSKFIIDTNNKFYTFCQPAMKDGGDWLLNIFEQLDDKSINKIKIIRDKEAETYFSDYLDDIKGISKSEYLDGNTKDDSFFSIDDEHSIKLFKEKLKNVTYFQDIYEICWNTLIHYLSDSWGDYNNWTLKEFRMADTALNIIFAAVTK